MTATVHPWETAPEHPPTESHGMSREEHAAAIRQIESELAEKLPAFEKTIAETTGKRDKARAALQKAQVELSQAQFARNCEASRLSQGLDHHKAALAAMADPQIAQFMRWIEGEQRLLRKGEAGHQDHYAKNLVADKRDLVAVFTDAPSRSARMAALTGAYRLAQELQFSPYKDVEGELQTLFDSIPPVKYEKVRVKE